MITRHQQPVYSESRWQTIAELSLCGGAGCELEAVERVTQILVRVRVPDPVLMEAKRAVTRIMERELSRAVADQARRTFTIVIRAQAAGLSESPSDDRDVPLRLGGWGFFLTSKVMTAADLDDTHHVVMSLHLYQEGHPA